MDVIESTVGQDGKGNLLRYVSLVAPPISHHPGSQDEPRLIAVTEEQRAAVTLVRHLIWWLYYELKLYRATPTARAKASLKARFDRIFGRTNGFTEQDAALTRLKDRKAELLAVLDRPEVPLNTNDSEHDIRDPVTLRKISGSTRSEEEASPADQDDTKARRSSTSWPWHSATAGQQVGFF